MSTPPTRDEQARQRYADLRGRPALDWSIVDEIKANTWYDFFDLETGACGECLMNPNGNWHLKPEGCHPTFLRHRNRDEQIRKRDITT